ncbi:hypothetical protein L1987_12040 [Smallanthus sonchifolius]|uniref:Uncharacterized protein n=1 Tax=Smallanthus sonchifolius TaxID=185202 RepID=A0ACB9JDJ5_9ASTR|nr:hypothetical protein L1987_12040 [Smallanthus sonchifolius]
MRFYRREAAASWRDTLQMRMSPVEPDWEAVPEVCRVALAEWDKAVAGLGEELMSILCEGLGIKSEKLKELSCLEGRNEVGGLLQVKCGDEWVDVDAVPGAIVINIGDLLQMMSNDEYKSVQHRVLANPVEGVRVSIDVFFTPSNQDKLYGPLPEVTSTTKPAVYQEFKYEDYIRRFFTKELDGKTLINFYKINNTKA